MKKYNFYFCALCNNLKAQDAADTTTPICCNEPMELLEVHTAESSTEKHVPVLDIEGDTVTVTVGSTLHPMLPAHYIRKIWLYTDKGLKTATLEPETQPVATFDLAPDEVVIGAYEYCNLHGLWYGEV